MCLKNTMQERTDFVSIVGQRLQSKSPQEIISLLTKKRDFLQSIEYTGCLDHTLLYNKEMKKHNLKISYETWYLKSFVPRCEVLQKKLITWYEFMIVGQKLIIRRRQKPLLTA